jgi:hypothetical protein
MADVMTPSSNLRKRKLNGQDALVGDDTSSAIKKVKNSEDRQTRSEGSKFS